MQRMQRTRGLGVSARFARTGLVAAVTIVTALAPVICLAQSEAPAATNVRVLLFNLNPTSTYSITKNSVLLTTANSSVSGLAIYDEVADVGDWHEAVETSGDPLPPSAPEGLVAQGDDVGCAQASWTENTENDIDFYRFYSGVSSVAGGQANSYDDSLDVGSTGTTVCGLPDGTYYFAVRAHNTAGLLSALSQEVSASVSNGSTQPPLPPLVVLATEGQPTCIEISWSASGSPEVVGYVVDYGTQSVEGGDAVSYEHSQDVGNTLAYSLCDLSNGTYYLAVRSKNHAGTTSAYSMEQTATVTPTAVFITAFSADAVSGGVALSWRIWTDEVLKGYKVLRSLDNHPTEIALGGGRLIDPSNDSWIDEDVEPVTTYNYTLVVIGEDGAEHRSHTERVTTRAWSMTLEQNVPNPFNPATSISFIVPEISRIMLAVYDVTGAQVNRLVDEVLPAGRSTIHWDGTNTAGDRVSSGTYFYRLTVGKRSTSRKMLLLK